MEETSLDMAAAGAHGVSGGSSTLTPKLLVEHLSGQTIHSRFESAELDVDRLGEATCIVLTTDDDSEREKLWIRAEDHAIVQLEIFNRFTEGARQSQKARLQSYLDRARSSGDQQATMLYEDALARLTRVRDIPDTLTTMTFNPRFDIDIPHDELTFTPPAAY